MQYSARNPFMIFLKKHLLFMVIIIVVLASSFFGLQALRSYGDGLVAQQEQDAAKTIAALDKEITAIKQRKAEEKLAAAAATAELVTTIDTDQAAAVDAAACNVGGGHANPTAIDVVVNKKHCMQPLTYAPDDLITVNGATLSSKAAGAFTELYNAAAAAGQGFNVTSSYRSFANQVSTYQYWVSTSGVAGADTYSARPGYSEHQTGFVIDIAAGSCALDCFGSTSQYQWMQQHAAEYGFIQRYYAGSEAITGYKAEEWHYRYVGTAVASDMTTKGIKTLEEYWNITGGNY